MEGGPGVCFYDSSIIDIFRGREGYRAIEDQESAPINLGIKYFDKSSFFWGGGRRARG